MVKATEKSIMEMSYGDFLRLLWFRIKDDAQGHFEQFLCNQQWYRKRKGGKWELRCIEKRVYWSPSNDFVEVMADFGRIVDVLKTEDWTNG